MGGRYYDPRLGHVINAALDEAKTTGGYMHRAPNPLDIFPGVGNFFTPPTWGYPELYIPEWQQEQSRSGWSWWQNLLFWGGMALLIIATKGAAAPLLKLAKGAKVAKVGIGIGQGAIVMGGSSIMSQGFTGMSQGNGFFGGISWGQVGLDVVFGGLSGGIGGLAKIPLQAAVIGFGASAVGEIANQAIAGNGWNVGNILARGVMGAGISFGTVSLAATAKGAVGNLAANKAIVTTVGTNPGVMLSSAMVKTASNADFWISVATTLSGMGASRFGGWLLG